MLYILSQNEIIVTMKMWDKVQDDWTMICDVNYDYTSTSWLIGFSSWPLDEMNN